MKPVVYILVHSYPYGRAEGFLEGELDVLGRLDDLEVRLLPCRGYAGPLRALPRGIHLEPPLLSGGVFTLALRACAAFLRPATWTLVAHELCLSAKAGGPGAHPGNLAVAFANVVYMSLLEMALSRRVRRRSQNARPLLYAYWLNVFACAAVRVKERGMAGAVVARAHGYDLYASRRLNGYMPLKPTYVRQFDAIFPISLDGKRYLEKTYGLPPERVCLARLGVSLPEGPSQPSSDGVLRIVSLAFCVPIKRIDRLVDALALFANEAPPGSVVEWTHIGDGPLFEELKRRASQLPAHRVRVHFLGHKSHEEVMRWFANNAIDVFVNTSESEGVPVSIMEAMGFGVPVIAPAVGGIPEIVNAQCGILLGNQPTPRDVADALHAAPLLRVPSLRVAARATVERDFHAHSNFVKFAEHLSALAKKSAAQAPGTRAR